MRWDILPRWQRPAAKPRRTESRVAAATERCEMPQKLLPKMTEAEAKGASHKMGVCHSVALHSPTTYGYRMGEVGVREIA